jgi:hypothetical protein
MHAHAIRGQNGRDFGIRVQIGRLLDCPKTAQIRQRWRLIWFDCLGKLNVA